MGATLHWTDGQIRIGDDHHAYGDPYDTAVFVQRIGDTAYLSAGNGKMPRRVQRQILQLLQAAGITTLVWDRVKDGKRRTVQISVSQTDSPRDRVGGDHFQCVPATGQFSPGRRENPTSAGERVTPRRNERNA